MRKILMILGTLLTVTILLSGSAVATWVYAQDAWGTDCTNELNARFAPDGNHATAGKNNPPTLGTLYLKLANDDKMPPDTEFTVFAGGSAVNETYRVEVMTDDLTINTTVGEGWDTENLTFKTPPDQGHEWQYIIIHGLTGLTNLWDTIYGPEIDAGGWNKP
ncbi:MAG: hypothetical protein JSV56_10390 [Methanomassiliicoccales archaeon]|nr:MAG: hypothetical protein JSV56_10390 [Methanomassiliicoccales archaeon]